MTIVSHIPTITQRYTQTTFGMGAFIRDEEGTIYRLDDSGKPIPQHAKDFFVDHPEYGSFFSNDLEGYTHQAICDQANEECRYNSALNPVQRAYTLMTKYIDDIRYRREIDRKARTYIN